MNGNEERISKSLAYYFGVSTIIAGIVSFLGLAYWLYKAEEQEFEFRQSIFYGLIVIGVVLCGLGIFLINRRDKRHSG